MSIKVHGESGMCLCMYDWLSYRRSLLGHWLACEYVCMYTCARLYVCMHMRATIPRLGLVYERNQAKASESVFAHPLSVSADERRPHQPLPQISIISIKQSDTLYFIGASRETFPFKNLTYGTCTNSLRSWRTYNQFAPVQTQNVCLIIRACSHAHDTCAQKKKVQLCAYS